MAQAGRMLLQNDTAQSTAAAKGELYNVAAVTLQANCSDSNKALATMSEMQSVVTNNLLSVSCCFLLSTEPSSKKGSFQLPVGLLV